MIKSVLFSSYILYFSVLCFDINAFNKIREILKYLTLLPERQGEFVMFLFLFFILFNNTLNFFALKIYNFEHNTKSIVRMK